MNEVHLRILISYCQRKLCTTCTPVILFEMKNRAVKQEEAFLRPDASEAISRQRTSNLDQQIAHVSRKCSSLLFFGTIGNFSSCRPVTVL